MNYSELSDFEINKAVYIAVVKGDLGNYKLSRHGNSLCVKDPYVDEFSYFDYCNSWVDAGQLMEDAMIDLKKNHGKLSSGHYSAIFNTGYSVHHAVNKNPKRAIAECFLMMREGE